jgi:hypothetical protein
MCSICGSVTEKNIELLTFDEVKILFPPQSFRNLQLGKLGNEAPVSVTI